MYLITIIYPNANIRNAPSMDRSDLFCLPWQNIAAYLQIH